MKIYRKRKRYSGVSRQSALDDFSELMKKLIDIEASHQNIASEKVQPKKREIKHDAKEHQLAICGQDTSFQATIRSLLKNRRILADLYKSFLKSYGLRGKPREAINE